MITALIDLWSSFHQAGNLSQMEAIARSMLAAIPDDTVALQFLGLSLYQMGRIDAARRVFRRVDEKCRAGHPAAAPAAGELATVTSYREATRAGSGLGEAWQHIALALTRFGFSNAAARAFQASRTARGNT